MTARTSFVRQDRVEYSFWLAFDEQGGLRMTRTEPGVERGERAMAMTLTIPRTLFRTPSLRAKIEVEDQGPPNLQIDTGAVAEAIRQVIGADVDLVVHPAVAV